MVVDAMNGIQKVRNKNLISLFSSCHYLVDLFDEISITKITREQNQEAHNLVRKALLKRAQTDNTENKDCISETLDEHAT
jgi:hypothetical protein